MPVRKPQPEAALIPEPLPSEVLPSSAESKPNLSVEWRQKFIIERQGKEMVLFQGLLDLAHQMGLRGIETTLVQLPTPENRNVAVMMAKVYMHGGFDDRVHQVKSFTGIGDADPSNVAPMLKTALLRMAETRAVARALRFATNVGITAFEELGGDTTDSEAHSHAAARPVKAAVSPAQPSNPPEAAQVQPTQSTPAEKRVLTPEQAEKAFWLLAGRVGVVHAGMTTAMIMSFRTNLAGGELPEVWDFEGWKYIADPIGQFCRAWDLTEATEGWQKGRDTIGQEAVVDYCQQVFGTAPTLPRDITREAWYKMARTLRVAGGLEPE